MEKKCVILANGDVPDKERIAYLQSVGHDLLICADGGANSAYKLGIVPDVIIGDFDSVKEEVLKYFKDKSEIIHSTSQFSTDVEKALTYAIDKGYGKAVFMGATGDRLDHTFCNMGITLKFYDRITVNIIHQASFLEVREGKFDLDTTPGETISLYGFDSITKVTTEGLKYPLYGESLQFGVREGTSNIALGKKVTLTVDNGRIFVIRDYEVLKKNGFFK